MNIFEKQSSMKHEQAGSVQMRAVNDECSKSHAEEVDKAPNVPPSNSGLLVQTGLIIF